MVRVRNLSMESTELKFLIESKIRHSYVEKYINKPFIDQEKIFILHYFYQDLQMSATKKQQYITTIMLVQIALDTHELIPSKDTDEMTETEKQLSVLAGDYYSGLYYYLLSELEDIDMIQILATAIKRINEYKMKLYDENIQSIDELFTTIQQIESLLFTQVARFIRVEDTIISITKEWLMINRLYQEKENIQKQQFSYIDHFVQEQISDTDKLTTIHIVDEEIHSRKQKLDELLVHLPYHFIVLKNTIRDKVKLAYKTSVAEEG